MGSVTLDIGDELQCRTATGGTSSFNPMRTTPRPPASTSSLGATDVHIAEAEREAESSPVEATRVTNNHHPVDLITSHMRPEPASNY
jgi:hypothetical protein